MAGELEALRGRLAAAMTARGFAAQAAALGRLVARSGGPEGALPVLAHRDDAVARAGEEVDADLADVLGPLAAAARWEQTAAYVASPPDASFLDLYAHATLADTGDDGDAALGLVLLGPGVRYPPHHHPAEEFYLPGGAIRWVHAIATEPAPEPAGVLVHHEPWQPHGMWTGERGVLLVYVWIGEVGTPAAFCG